jgi:hypothetical protein
MRRGKIKAVDGGDHQPEEVAVEFRNMRYIYTPASTVPSAWVTAGRLKEREEISRVSPMKSYFSDKWVPLLSNGYQ